MRVKIKSIIGQIELTTKGAKNMFTQKYHIGFDAQKFNSTEISTFTVYWVQTFNLDSHGILSQRATIQNVPFPMISTPIWRQESCL